ncbi:MAG: ABC transporter ATP-binding protein [Oliverpabstia sp.]
MKDEKKVLLEIKNVSKSFRIRSKSLLGRAQTLHALSNVSLEIYEGETLGIIGESGCGKSTLGKCIVGLHEPSEGEIIYNGKFLCSSKENHFKDVRKDIQMIFQDPYSSLNPRKTCLQSIEEPMLIHKFDLNRNEREQEVRRIMKAVGLDEQHVYRYPHEFSGGQRQRINIARALVMNPHVIVCDEPVSALDVSIQAQVLNLFKSIQKEFNLTYIFISHDLSVIKYISDRIAIMYLGQVVELCEAQDIYKHPLHPYTQALLSAIPPVSPFEKKTRIELEGDVPSPIGEMEGCPLAGRCPRCSERCQKEKPILKPVGNDHQVACFLY